MNGVILGIAATLSISLTNVFSRLHFDAGSNPTTFLLLRYALFVPLLAATLAALGRLRRVTPGNRGDLLIAGLANVAGAGSLAFAIERIAVSLAVIVLYLFPLFTLLMTSALRRRRPPPAMLAALVVAFAGLVLALDVGGVGLPDPIGVGFALAAALGIAASFAWADHRLGEVADGPRLLGLTAVGLGAVTVLALVRGDVVWPLPEPHGWSTLLVATATFGAATGAMFMAISRIGSSATAMLMNLEPPLTALLAVLLLGDRLAPVQLLGIAVVIAAVLAAQRLAPPRPAPA